MTYLMSGSQIAEAMESISEALAKPVYVEKPAVADEVNPEELMYYDSASMSKHLEVSERTLHRYRKDGIIKFTAVGGRIYYPKNFLNIPAPKIKPQSAPPLFCSAECHQKIVLQSRQRPRSKIIDIHRLAKSICKVPRQIKTYGSSDVLRMRMLHRKARQEKGSNLHLWPKKIKFTSLPFKKQSNSPRL